MCFLNVTIRQINYHYQIFDFCRKALVLIKFVKVCFVAFESEIALAKLLLDAASRINQIDAIKGAFSVPILLRFALQREVGRDR